MKWGILVILSGMSDAIACWLIVILMLRMRNGHQDRLATWLAFAFGMIGLNSSVNSVLMISFPFSPQIGGPVWLAHLAQTISVWILFSYLIRKPDKH